MPCLDIKDGRIVKGVKFEDLKDAGDPVENSLAYCAAGADEIIMLDISATIENRPLMQDVVSEVSEAVSVPFTVGGGIKDFQSAEAVFKAGADRICVSSAAFRQPEMLKELGYQFGAKRVTVAIDAGPSETCPSGYEVLLDGGRTSTGKDVLDWVKQIDDYEIGTILPTSKRTDGMQSGYDLALIKKICSVTDKDVVASGGAGTLEHFYEAAAAGATILLAASVFHYNLIGIRDLKEFLYARKINVIY